MVGVLDTENSINVFKHFFFVGWDQRCDTRFMSGKDGSTRTWDGKLLSGTSDSSGTGTPRLAKRADAEYSAEKVCFDETA